MPISFGSFGDIVTVLQLARHAQAALSGASDAREEINSVILDVSAYRRVLQLIRDRVVQRPSALEPNLEAWMEELILSCDDTVRRIARKLAPFVDRQFPAHHGDV
ncbi:hypothetical protein AURDEDRAFT_166694 [Auricularia subglabra TFB-10046 SS5]|nr:hypothetical protein AURDEDRAFT_166694 [Auricularia subglabra TFB-10046 SS5]